MDRCILKEGTVLQLFSIFSLDVELRTIFKALFANQQFTIDEMHNYRMAVTEREVAHLIIFDILSIFLVLIFFLIPFYRWKSTFFLTLNIWP